MKDKPEKECRPSQATSNFEIRLTSVDFLQCPGCKGTKMRYLTEGVYECNACGECVSEDDEDLD